MRQRRGNTFEVCSVWKQFRWKGVLLLSTDKSAHLILQPVQNNPPNHLPVIFSGSGFGTHRSLSVSVRVFCCRRWTMKTVTATPMMSPMATTPPRIPITPPGGPWGIGFSADKRRNDSVSLGVLWVIDGARLYLAEKLQKKKLAVGRKWWD